MKGCTVSGWYIDGGGGSCGVAGYVESCKDLINVTRHGQRNSVGRRVKVDGEANVRVTIPVDLDFVQLTQSGDKVVSTKWGGLLDTKVVDDECEDRVIGSVSK